MSWERLRLLTTQIVFFSAELPDGDLLSCVPDFQVSFPQINFQIISLDNLFFQKIIFPFFEWRSCSDVKQSIDDAYQSFIQEHART